MATCNGLICETAGGGIEIINIDIISIRSDCAGVVLQWRPVRDGVWLITDACNTVEDAAHLYQDASERMSGEWRIVEFLAN